MSFFGNLSSLFGQKQANDKKALKVQKKPGAPAHAAQVAPAKAAVPQGQPQQQVQTTSAQQMAPKPGLAPLAQRPPVRPAAPAISQANLAQLDSMAREAQAKAREIIVEAKDEALMIRSEAERKARQLEQELVTQQRSLEQKLDKLEDKLGQITTK